MSPWPRQRLPAPWPVSTHAADPQTPRSARPCGAHVAWSSNSTPNRPESAVCSVVISTRVARRNSWMRCAPPDCRRVSHASIPSPPFRVLSRDARQDGADLRGVPPAATRRPHAACIQHFGDPSQACHAAGSNLLNDRDHVFGEPAGAVDRARGADCLRLGEVGPVAEYGALFFCGRRARRGCARRSSGVPPPTCLLHAWLEDQSLGERTVFVTNPHNNEADATLVLGAELQPGLYRLRV